MVDTAHLAAAEEGEDLARFSLSMANLQTVVVVSQMREHRLIHLTQLII